MKVTMTTFFDEQRQCWRVRFRGPDFDTKLNVPDDEFALEGVSPQSQSKRAENVAIEWAIKKKAEMLQPKAAGPLYIRDVFDLMRAVNPDQVTDATWARNVIHLRNLERLPTREPLGAALPESIDGRLAAMYRNERLAEGAASRTVTGELVFLIRLLRFGYEEASSATGMSVRRQLDLRGALTQYNCYPPLVVASSHLLPSAALEGGGRTGWGGESAWRRAGS